jgi:DNA-binding MarR family transcriptional regulator
VAIDSTSADVAGPQWLSDREQRTWRSFIAVQTKLNTHLQRQLQRESNLSLADYEVLVELSESPAGRMRAFELGRRTQWEKSRLSHHLSRMQHRGLVAREACPTEPRYAEIVLTEAGRAAIEAAAPRHCEQVRALFLSALTPEQLDQFGSVCEAVLTRLGESPEPDPCDGVPTATLSIKDTTGDDATAC